MQTTLKPICYVAGQSAGHILPALTLAKKELYPILFIASKKQLDKNILNKQDFIQKKYFLNISGKYIKPFIMLYALIKSIIILLKNRPQKIVTTSGLVSIPVCLAAKILRIPFDIYELNVEPGRSTLFLAPFANKIIICFKESQKYFPNNKCLLDKYPVQFSDEIKKLSRLEIIKNLDLEEDKKIILILGGSQGSMSINKLIYNSAEKLKNFQIIHQTGSLDNFDYKQMYNKLNIKSFVVDYYSKIEQLLIASDLVICRSGAGTLAEVIFFEKKCITVPLEANTTIHQVNNAKFLSQEYPNLITFAMQKDIEKNIDLFIQLIYKAIA